MIAITYTGNSPHYVARIRGKTYVFEWNKSVGIGKRKGEVREKDAEALSKRRDKKGKKIFLLE